MAGALGYGPEALRAGELSNTQAEGVSPIPKKSLPKSNELLRIFVRILVLDYCSQLLARLTLLFLRGK